MVCALGMSNFTAGKLKSITGVVNVITDDDNRHYGNYMSYILVKYWTGQEFSPNDLALNLTWLKTF